ncbi:MAG: GNAT family N-acetyltransferase [Bacteroidota bacterium]
MAQVQQLFGEEIQSVSYALRAYSFYASPPYYSEENDIADRREYYQKYRGFAYMDAGEALTFALDIPMEQNIRGTFLPMSGIAAVVSDPKARRQGLVRQTLAHLLKVGKEQGSVLSALYPFRESFYQRMGYTSFPLHQQLIFPVSSLSSLLKVDLPGTVNRHPMLEKYEEYRAFLKQHAQDVHGFAWNGLGGWDVRVAEKKQFWVAIARDQGKIIGVMLYKVEGYEESLLVERLYYQNSLAKYLLLNWLARHEGQVRDIKLNLPSYARAETFWTDLSPKLSAATPPMGRIVDLQGLKGIAVGEGVFSAQIIDPICPWQEGIWTFEGSDGYLDVRQGKQADCQLTIQALSALVYGTHDPGDFTFRGWGKPSAETQMHMRQIFSRQLPYIHEAF